MDMNMCACVHTHVCVCVCARAQVHGHMYDGQHPMTSVFKHTKRLDTLGLQPT